VPGVEAGYGVRPGDELVVTDGSRPVARFLVEGVDVQPAKGRVRAQRRHAARTTTMRAQWTTVTRVAGRGN